ncbi:MAG: transposase, partial [Bacteroidetes bacterium]|nr:transposase [Bacteroidota bacterium]
NPIEGKFGQAKTAYGLNRIKARLSQTSESWIATIILVLNLVKLTGLEVYCQILTTITFSAKWFVEFYQKNFFPGIFRINLELKTC